MDVMVTDGNQRSTLAVVRSLGRHGLEVTVAESGTKSLAGSSRFCRGKFIYPSPSSDPGGFQRELLNYLKIRPHRLLIPMTDITCYLVDEIRGELERYIKIALPGQEAFGRASDKRSLMKLANSLRVPIPETEFIEDINELERLASKLRYPVVLKPARSRLHTSDGWLSGTVTYADSKEELISKYEEMHARIEYPLIQERIEGQGHGVFLLFADGEALASFGHRRIREKPPSGGVSVLREAVMPDGEVLDQACRLLKALDWQGPAMVEFKIDRKSGVPKLMEINGRLWGSLQLAVDAGVDFPYLLYRLMNGEKPGKVDKFREGVKTRWLLGDLDHLLIILLNGRKKLSLPENHPGRMKTFCDFFKSFFRKDTRLEIWRRDDLGPAFYELWEYLRTSWHSLKRRLS